MLLVILFRCRHLMKVGTRCQVNAGRTRGLHSFLQRPGAPGV